MAAHGHRAGSAEVIEVGAEKFVDGDGQNSSEGNGIASGGQLAILNRKRLAGLGGVEGIESGSGDRVLARAGGIARIGALQPHSIDGDVVLVGDKVRDSSGIERRRRNRAVEGGQRVGAVRGEVNWPPATTPGRSHDLASELLVVAPDGKHTKNRTVAEEEVNRRGIVF